MLVRALGSPAQIVAKFAAPRQRRILSLALLRSAGTPRLSAGFRLVGQAQRQPGPLRKKFVFGYLSGEFLKIMGGVC